MVRRGSTVRVRQRLCDAHRARLDRQPSAVVVVQPRVAASSRVRKATSRPRVKNRRGNADLVGVAMSITDGARLMRASFDIVRRNRALLWFPVISTGCLAFTAGFWIFEGTWLYAVRGPALLFVPLVVAGLYSLFFVGMFFSVALAGAAAQAIDGGEPSFSDGVNVAWTRLGRIAGWAGYSLFVALALEFVKGIKGLRWLGTAAQIAWSFATIFVVPMIALEGLDSASARGRSFQLAKENWRAESGGLGALRATLLIPGLLFYLDGKLLFTGHVHSLAGKALLGAVLLCAFGVGVAASVVRQVFAVTLYRRATASGTA